ncbi:CocE/NonD family hydrolase [Arthrobacter sp. EpRS71]|uniref:CocE/NonD family hydrolase n=1 Tax=Arthrobacter sp. EpRS71 TaxID=1743141 RepID=UPI0007475431|nr:CocE/NonD family hydrolase [Arthrobacter sp. EpRS71]KUM36702.1 X-Pro dipeptidyl-peptidase [Arthrobacter sp. EpRS71]
MTHLYHPNVPLVTRDGVTLVADVWRPLEGRTPTLLLRTPYDRRATHQFGGHNSPTPSLMPLINAGYAVVIQDARGTGMSDGIFEPKLNEIVDGQDTVAWVREQSWSDGTVAMYGQSYMGMVQWALAISGTPGLRAIIPTTAALDWYRDAWYSQGGAMSLSLNTWWNALMYSGQERRNSISDPGHNPASQERLDGALLDPLELNSFTPLADLPVHGTGRWFDDFIAHPGFDEYWKRQDWSGPEIMSKVSVPVFSIGGWYDLKVSGTVGGFIGVRRHGGSEEAREKSRLLIGPWDHTSFTGRFADRSYGIRAEADISAEHIAFFDENLRGVPLTAPAPRVRIFVMGIDRWRNEVDWPLPDTRYVGYYLDSGGAAATRHGDGVLQVTLPERDTFDEFIYNPHDPVPTAGGALLPAQPGLIGPVDQSKVDGREDVLCYVTPVLEKSLEVTGHVELKVFMSSSAVDTDITAKLIDVFPDGRAFNLCDGMLRLRYRGGLSTPSPLVPEEVYEVTVNMGLTSNVFLPGHRLRLDISSSNFPRFDRNTNTGGIIAHESVDAAVAASNRVHHGPLNSSRLILPIIAR